MGTNEHRLAGGGGGLDKVGFLSPSSSAKATEDEQSKVIFPLPLFGIKARPNVRHDAGRTFFALFFYLYNSRIAINGWSFGSSGCEQFPI